MQIVILNQETILSFEKYNSVILARFFASMILHIA